MNRKLEKAAVLGAGVMGAQIAAHLANAGVSVTLLDIVPPSLSPAEEAAGLTLADPKVRNRFAAQAVENMHKMKLAPFFTREQAALIRTGNFEDHLEWLKDADWIIEAIVERLDLKKALYERIESFRKPGSLITTNTSGIPIGSLSVGRSDDFRTNFLGTHFFNPPRYMHLVEIITTPDTNPEAACFSAGLCDKVLGKGLVYANDTPNFIANRIGIFGILQTIKVMTEGGYSITEVDKMSGPAIGRPKSATFRTADLAGLDTTMLVAGNVYDNAPHDEYRTTFIVPDFFKDMVARKWLGDKTGQGFYKKVQGAGGREILALDYKTMEYVPQPKVSFPSLENAKNISDLGERLRTLVYGKDRVGEFLWPVISETLLYTARRIPEIANDPIQVDKAMRWGFNWEMGPFEMWDALGVEKTVKKLQAEGREIPQLVQDLLNSGRKSWYESEKGVTRVFMPAAKEHVEVPDQSGVIVLKALKDREQVIKKNSGATLVDLGDGVACLEFHTKMNTIGSDTVSMMQQAVKEVEKNFEGLVISNQADNFCAGANLMMVMLAVQEGEWDELNQMIRAFQNANMNLRYSAKPVVVAPFGLTLGGGCEITLHADKVRAAAETYIGMVEVGVGLIPAGGGTKEMLLRSADRIKGSDADLFPYLKDVFTNIATAKVATNAIDARKFGYIRPTDGISMNKDRLIADAKATVLGLVKEGYQQPKQRTDIPALGESALAALKLGAHMLHRGGFASEHDIKIAGKVAYVLTGGDLNHPTKVSEQYLLDLEREAFLSLLGERKTLERIQSLLKTGKPVRN